jgi:hypothetical protein
LPEFTGKLNQMASAVAKPGEDREANHQQGGASLVARKLCKRHPNGRIVKFVKSLQTLAVSLLYLLINKKLTDLHP